MGLGEAALFGIVQGLTEFLPVSSSGHLAILQQLVGMNPPGITMEVLAHLGTMLAIVAVFAGDVYAILAGFARGVSGLLRGRTYIRTFLANPDVRLGVLIIIGSLPTALVGLAFKPFFESMFDSLRTVGVGLMVTAALLFAAERVRRGRRTLDRLTVGDALLVGLLQGAAIAPGISRSGATISAALFNGVERESAAKFSLLLSLPAVLGASVLELGGNHPSSALHAPGVSLFGVFLVSFLFGYIAIRWLLNVLKGGHLYGFSLYCFLLGVSTVIADFMTRHLV